MSQIPQGPPIKITAGDSSTFYILDVCHPSSEWTLAYTLFGTDLDPVSTEGTAQPDGSYLIALAGPQTPTMIPVEYLTASVFTKGSERKTINGPTIWILPDPTKKLDKSENQQQLEALQAVALRLNRGENSAVGMNGQTFTKKNLADVNKQVVYLQARVIREKDLLRAILELPDRSTMQTAFGPDYTGYNQSIFPNLNLR